MPAKLTLEKILLKFKKVHGDKYDYSKVVYKRSTTKVIISCPSHGEFKQAPSNHSGGQGCPKCGTERSSASHQYSTKDFIEICTKIHNSKYDYSNTTYSKAKEKVTIICPTHGEFKQEAHVHMSGRGCNRCACNVRNVHLQEANNKIKVPYTEVLEKAKVVHLDRYIYPKEEYYKNLSTPISIECPDHGPFMQRMSDHLRGNGCSSCALRGFDSSSPSIMYYLSINNGEAYKIGVTNRTVQERFLVKELVNIEVLFYIEFDTGREAYLLEQSILKKFKLNKYTKDNLLSSGNTELFNCNILPFKNPTLTQILNTIKE